MEEQIVEPGPGQDKILKILKIFEKHIARLSFSEEQKTLPASAEAMLLPASGDHGPGHLREGPHQMVVKISSSQAISKTPPSCYWLGSVLTSWYLRCLSRKPVMRLSSFVLLVTRP